MTPKGQEDSFEALYNEGTRLLHKGQKTAAIELLEKAHRLEPDHTDAAMNLGSAYILTGRFKMASSLLERVVHNDPENAMLWTNLGAAYLGNPVLARNEEQLRAIEAFQRALRLNPAAPNVAYNIGLIYLDRKEKDKAAHWFQEALKANPNDRDATGLLKKLTLAKEEED